MKQIINGRRYNTDTAFEIGHASFGYGGDFHGWNGRLFKTPAGRYFLAGRGGPMTMWARSEGNNGTTGSEGIIPLTEEDAFIWAQKNLEDFIVENHFSHLAKDA